MSRWITGLWRSSSWLVAMALGACLAAVYFANRGARWRGDWAWTVDQLAGATIFVATGTAAVAAYDAARSRQFVDEFATGGVGRWVRAATSTVLPTFLGSWLGLLAVGAAALTWTAAVGVVLPTWDTPVTVLLAGTALAVASAVGHVLGRLVAPPIVAAAVAAASSYALAFAVLLWRLPPVLPPGGATSTLTGIGLDPVVVLETVVFAATLVLAALLISLARAPVATRAPAVARLGGVVVVGGAVTFGLAGYHGTELYRVDPRPLAFVCQGRLVQTCLARPNVGQLSAWADALDRAASALEAAGLSALSRYSQEVPGRAPPAGSGVIPVSQDINIAPPTTAEIAGTLARGHPCAVDGARITPSVGAQLAKASEVEYWLSIIYSDLLSAAGAAVDAQAQEALADWAARTTPEERTTWVRDAVAAKARCDLEALSRSADARP